MLRYPIMFKISFEQSDFIPPTDPLTRIESAIGCDGSECGLVTCIVEGASPVDILPHFHLVESEPGAWTRVLPIQG